MDALTLIFIIVILAFVARRVRNNFKARQIRDLELWKEL